MCFNPFFSLPLLLDGYTDRCRYMRIDIDRYPICIKLPMYLTHTYIHMHTYTYTPLVLPKLNILVILFLLPYFKDILFPHLFFNYIFSWLQNIYYMDILHTHSIYTHNHYSIVDNISHFQFGGILQIILY